MRLFVWSVYIAGKNAGKNAVKAFNGGSGCDRAHYRKLYNEKGQKSTKTALSQPLCALTIKHFIDMIITTVKAKIEEKPKRTDFCFYCMIIRIKN